MDPCMSSQGETTLNGVIEFTGKGYSKARVEVFGNELTSDLVFHVGDEEMHAHKVILAAHSPVFKAEFVDYERENLVANKYEISTAQHDSSKHEVLIGDMEPEVFKAMLHFIYKGTIPHCDHSRAFFEKLLGVGDRYGLERLGKMCKSRLRRDISVDSVVDLLVVADRYHAEELRTDCLEFAVKNLTRIVLTQGFTHLEENYPMLVSKLLKKGMEEESEQGCFPASLLRFKSR